MKRWIIVLLLLLLLLCGCRKQVPPAADVNDEPVAVQKEKVPAIVNADLPERDPFDLRSGSSKRGTPADVPADGRNPFLVANATAEWQKKTDHVSTAGRNPFVTGSSEENVPPLVEEPGIPVSPGEVEPPQPGEGLVVQVTTLERCWLDVFVDQRRVLRTNVPVGESLSWQGQQEVLLDQVGRSWAIQLNVNGQHLGLLSDLIEELATSPQVVAGVQISLERTYPGSVLVGLSFKERN